MAGATKENIPGGSSTEEQRSQTAFSPKTLRAAGLLSVAGVGSFLTARCGDARNSPPWPPPKSLAAAPLVVSKQALGQNDLANHTVGWLYQSIRNVRSPSVGKGSALSLARGRDCVNVLRVPRKIRQLVADLERVGFVVVPGGKGSHRKFRHQKFPGALILSGHDGDDAHHYQERQVRNAIRAASK